MPKTGNCFLLYYESCKFPIQSIKLNNLKLVSYTFTYRRPNYQNKSNRIINLCSKIIKALISNAVSALYLYSHILLYIRGEFN